MFSKWWRRVVNKSNGRPVRSRFRPANVSGVLALELLEDRRLLSFLAPVNYNTGGPPVTVVVADLKGDQKLDLVTGNSIGTVSVLLGNGDGSFQAPQNYIATDGSVNSVAVGDFNGDGKLDLVTANTGRDTGDPGDMSVLLGNGDGTFQPARHFSPGVGPGHMTAADLNHDGKLDLVVGFNGTCCDFHGSVAVLLGNGDGTFRPGWTYDTGPYSFPIPAVADFNHDGKLDLAVVSGTVNGSVSVFLGNGDGTFGAPHTYAVGSNPSSVAVGDLNRDGSPDLVVANSAFPSGSPSVSVLLGNGDGTFRDAQNYDAGQRPASVALGDFNGDQRLDLVVANNGSGTVSVLLGNGDGTFGAPQNYDVGLQPSSVAVGDFNGDGALDLVTANSYSGYNVSVRLGNGDGTFASLPKYDTGLSGPMVVGDFNGDGIPDIAVANGGMVSVLLGNGDGTFQSPRISTFEAYGGATSLAVGDFEGNGRLDLVVATNGYRQYPGLVSVLLGNGDGTFRTSFTYAKSSMTPASSVAVGDFNGDRQLDLVVSNLDSTGSLSVLLGNGDGTFQAPQDYVLGSSPITVVVADLNNDSRPDIVTADISSTFEGSVSILLGNGDGSFQNPQTIALGQHPSALAIGDLNGDGIPDLVVSNVVDSLDTGGITVLLGNGDGTFGAGVNYFTGNIITCLELADFNQDGQLDLAAGFAGANGPAGVGVLLGNGDGSFQPTSLSYGSAARVGAVADFNGDGFPDVVTPNVLSNTLSVVLNAADWSGGPAGPSGPHAPPAGAKKGLSGIRVAEFAATMGLQANGPKQSWPPSSTQETVAQETARHPLTSPDVDRLFAVDVVGRHAFSSLLDEREATVVWRPGPFGKDDMLLEQALTALP